MKQFSGATGWSLFPFGCGNLLLFADPQWAVMSGGNILTTGLLVSVLSYLKCLPSFCVELCDTFVVLLFYC